MTLEWAQSISHVETADYALKFRETEGFKRNGEHDDYTQSAKEVFKSQFSYLLSTKFCQFIFLIQLKLFIFQVKYMSLLMLRFGAFKFLWADAVVLKYVGEVQISIGRWLIYVTEIVC